LWFGCARGFLSPPVVVAFCAVFDILKFYFRRSSKY